MSYAEEERDRVYDAALDRNRVGQQYEEGRARKTMAAAQQAELSLAENRGDLLRRSKFRDASVMAMAVFAQTMRSLPDTLERTANLSPTQAQVVQECIDHALGSLSEAFKRLNKE